MLEQDTTRKERVDKNSVAQLELKIGNNKEYKIEAIQDSVVYAIKLEVGHLLGLYYLVSWKSYPKAENTWKPTSVV